MKNVRVVSDDGTFLFLHTGPTPRIGDTLNGYIVVGIDADEIVVE